MQLIHAFLLEEPGTGRGELCSRHIYEVDRSESGHLIELHRPAYRKAGMDFTVRCPTIRFNPGNRLIRYMPRHEDLHTAFTTLRQRFGADYELVRAAINAVYECTEVVGLDRLAEMNSGTLAGGDECPADVAVLASKWLFAEQDVRYWHNSGRTMFYEFLSETGLV